MHHNPLYAPPPPARRFPPSMLGRGGGTSKLCPIIVKDTLSATADLVGPFLGTQEELDEILVKVAKAASPDKDARGNIVVDFDFCFNLVMTIYYDRHALQVDNLEQLFRKFDDNEDDEMSLEEFTMAVGSLLPDVDSLEIASMYDRVLGMQDSKGIKEAATAFSSIMVEYIGVGGAGAASLSTHKKTSANMSVTRLQSGDRGSFRGGGSAGRRRSKTPNGSRKNLRGDSQGSLEDGIAEGAEGVRADDGGEGKGGGGGGGAEDGSSSEALREQMAVRVQCAWRCKQGRFAYNLRKQAMRVRRAADAAEVMDHAVVDAKVNAETVEEVEVEGGAVVDKTADVASQLRQLREHLETLPDETSALEMRSAPSQTRRLAPRGDGGGGKGGDGGEGKGGDGGEGKRDEAGSVAVEAPGAAAPQLDGRFHGNE